MRCLVAAICQNACAACQNTASRLPYACQNSPAETLRRLPNTACQRANMLLPHMPAEKRDACQNLPAETLRRLPKYRLPKYRLPTCQHAYSLPGTCLPRRDMPATCVPPPAKTRLMPRHPQSYSIPCYQHNRQPNESRHSMFEIREVQLPSRSRTEKLW